MSNHSPAILTEQQAAALAVASSSLDWEVYVGANDEFAFDLHASGPTEDGGAYVEGICTDSGQHYRLTVTAEATVQPEGDDQ